jgi:NAD-dependent dihydropyrimidine dehydrogenase PreA subunit
MTATLERPKPVLFPQFCKGCGRCIDACAHHCIAPGSDVNPATGLIPVVLDLERCTACGLCFDACRSRTVFALIRSRRRRRRPQPLRPCPTP